MEITNPTSHSAWFPGPETGKWQTTLRALRWMLCPTATHPSNHKWTELAYNKLAELGRHKDLKRESLPSWAFVRMWCFTAILSLTFVSLYLPISHVKCLPYGCLCTARAALLKTLPYVVAYKYSIMRNVGSGAICWCWPITATCFDI